ncbi:MAG: nucleotidyltransferase domain-containing protein [Nanoarchaeota archaeon]
MNKEDLIGYTESFISFVMSEIGKSVNQIILFGSVARGEFDKKSDIDLFFDVKREDRLNIEENLKKRLSKFYKSKLFEIWKLKGIENVISIHVGVLNEWKLKRSIISDGIILYGKYKEAPENLKHYLLIVNEPIKDIAKRNKIIRKTIGRKEKAYTKEGVLKKANGKIISQRVIMVPIEDSKQIIDLFHREKVSFKIYEFWSD